MYPAPSLHRCSTLRLMLLIGSTESCQLEGSDLASHINFGGAIVPVQKSQVGVTARFKMAVLGHNVGVEQSAKELMRIRQCESTTQATWGGGHLSIDKEFNRISLITNGLILTEVPWFHATPIKQSIGEQAWRPRRKPIYVSKEGRAKSKKNCQLERLQTERDGNKQE